MSSVLNTLSESTCFNISKNITPYTFLLVFKIIESLQFIFDIIYTYSNIISESAFTQTFSPPSGKFRLL